MSEGGRVGREDEAGGPGWAMARNRQGALQRSRPLALTLAPAALCTHQPFGVMADTSLSRQTGARQQHARCSNACKGQLTCMTTGRIIQVPTFLVD
jgi:hypothetical protein